MIKPTVVLVHGLGGSPTSLGDLPDAMTRAGYQVLTPTLPGHATSVDDLECVGLHDWLGALAQLLVGRGPSVIVGQSLGGVLALCAAAESSAVRGVVCINAPVSPGDPDVVEHLERLLTRGVTRQPVGEPDLRDRRAVDPGYDELPITALMALISAGDRASRVLDRVEVPVMVVTSDHDQVVDPWIGDQLAGALRGPVTRLTLPNSGHVACRDLDRHMLAAEITTWLERLSVAST
jgi:carboxylesterase